MSKGKLTFLPLIVLSILLLNECYLDAGLIIPIDHAYQNPLKTGKASWYSQQSPGINVRTANNEVFDDTDLTAAMWDVPFHQKIKVTNLENGKSVTVRVNDRGPHRRYVRKGRVIDLSKQAFLNIAPLNRGLIRVELEFLPSEKAI